MRNLLMATAAAVGLLATPAFAHCDSMDGPVVQDAQRALEAQDLTPVLKWVTADDEDEIRSAFDMTLTVREETDAARAVAGSKPLTSQAKRTGKVEASKCVMAAAPDRPSTRARQVVATSLPTGVMAPSPVTTTLRFISRRPSR